MRFRPAYRFHPRPLMILAAVVLCLIASMAFAQSRSVAPAARPAPSAGGTFGAPAASGLTSGAAPGITSGAPSPSGLTSGSGATSLPPGAPAPGGLTSGTAGAAVTPAPTTSVTPGVGTTPDTTATTTGGSTRGVVVLPADPATQPQQSLPAAAGVGDATGTAAGTAGAAGTTGSMGATGTVQGNGGVVVITPGGAAGGVSNGVPSVAPNGRIAQAGPLTALQVAQMFGQADVNGDGLLSRAEALRLPMVTMTFEDMDTNRDGSVSRSEYDASLR